MEKLENPVKDEDDEPKKFVSLAEINNKLTLKKAHSEKRDDVEINQQSCFFFYQALSGECIFLHPLCLQILESDE